MSMDLLEPTDRAFSGRQDTQQLEQQEQQEQQPSTPVRYLPVNMIPNCSHWNFPDRTHGVADGHAAFTELQHWAAGDGWHYPRP